MATANLKITVRARTLLGGAIAWIRAGDVTRVLLLGRTVYEQVGAVAQAKAPGVLFSRVGPVWRFRLFDRFSVRGVGWRIGAGRTDG